MIGGFLHKISGQFFNFNSVAMASLAASNDSSSSKATADAAREAAEDAMAMALLGERDASNKMYAKVRVKQKHTKAVDAVARKYEKFASKVERVYTKRYRI